MVNRLSLIINVKKSKLYPGISFWNLLAALYAKKTIRLNRTGLYDYAENALGQIIYHR